MGDPITSTILLVRLLAETSSSILYSVAKLGGWCMAAIGPFVISLSIAGCLSLLCFQRYYSLEELRCEGAFKRGERCKNNDMKRKALWTLFTQGQERDMQLEKEEKERISNQRKKRGNRKKRMIIEVTDLGKGGENTFNEIKLKKGDELHIEEDVTSGEEELEVEANIGRLSSQISQAMDELENSRVKRFFYQLDNHCT